MRHQFLRAAAGNSAPPGGIEGYQFEITTPADDTAFRVPDTGTLNYNVDWGDGIEEFGITTTRRSHTYAVAGTYRIKITTSQAYRPSWLLSPESGWLTAIIGAADDFPFAADMAQAWRGVTSIHECVISGLSGVTSLNRAWLANSGVTSIILPPGQLGPALTDCNTIAFSAANLAHFSPGVFDNATNCLDFGEGFRQCALTAQSIENILVSIDTAGATNGTISFIQGTNAIYSTWSTAAQNAKTNLQAKGWTVTNRT